MKDNHHIRTYIETVRGAKEIDELAITQLCSQAGVRIEFTNQDENPKRITFEEFKQWLNTDLPDKGDVISLKHTIGIVSNVDHSSITIGVYLDNSGNLVTTPQTIQLDKNNRYNNATDEEALKLQIALYNDKLTWNKKFYKLNPLFIPTDNQQIRLSTLTKKVGIGVFKEINTKGEIIMYCIKLDEEPIRFSLNENLGLATNYILDLANNSERQLLKTELQKIGKVWNGYEKRIEPVDFRVEPGCGYFYINDFLEIIKAIDKRKPKDQKRFSCGNYYNCYTEVNEIKEKIVKERQIQLLKTFPQE